jgi:formamidopyrimidine-DNA glycosylase
MPELPEVEVVVRQLREKIQGRVIKDFYINYFSKRTFKCFKGVGLNDLKEKKIKKIERKGKNILFYIDKYILLIHQKMSGPLILDKFSLKKEGVYLKDSFLKHVHFCIFLNNIALALYDVRVFAKVNVGLKDDVLNSVKIGIDALSDNLDGALFLSILLKRKMKIKPFLLDQSNISGVGNIYADESLFCAKISPFKYTNTFSLKESKKLLNCIKEILKKSIELKGSSIQFFVGINNEEGQTSKIHKVYQKEDQRCVRCKEKIKKTKISGRYTRYCDKCQKC